MAKFFKVQVQLSNVRLSFPNIFEPKGFNGGEAKYSASFLIEKEDTDNLNRINKAIEAVKANQWPQGAPKFKENQVCLRDGDGEEWDGYKDHYFLSSSNIIKPVVRDLDGSDLTVKSIDNNVGDKPLAGDYVNAVVEIWVQDNSYGKRVNAWLKGVQYVKKGPRFGGISDDDMFASTTVKRELTDEEKEAKEMENIFGV